MFYLSFNIIAAKKVVEVTLFSACIFARILNLLGFFFVLSLFFHAALQV